ncbi:unnamed protein product [Caenorhabditis angaria]|uniref:U2A'/phosphoprotein 32 family A C-terminal domain-containing protein n=1 Tax=Caenorhabditis angaria TaxID=860376 RepID=A0A9P1N6H8_9PELO|nr:unnamed protein product [Caenorhabditis angaria]
MDKFEESWAEQLKKLSDMNIRLDIKDERRNKYEETTEASLETINNQTSKVRKVSDITSNIKLLSGRISDEKVIFDWFSIRNPLEIMLAYFDCSRILKDSNDLSMRVTVLDLSEMKLTKLAGIQEMVNVQFLSLRKNKLTSLKKLNRLPLLKLLDVSSNHISKLENLPSSIIYLDVSSNRLQNLAFSQNLANCRHLKLSKNQIKSMKGLEICGAAEILFLNDNLLKDRNEMEILKNMPKLTHVDLSQNPISQMDGYKSKIMQNAQFLISLDRQLIPVEERHISTSKQASRGLSLELIDRICPEWKSKQELMIVDQKIEQIILEKSQLEELSHVRLMDLSKNKLSSVKEIQTLNITSLELSENSLKNIAISGDFEVFRNLENLNISNNSITNTTLIRLGLNLLAKLKNIDLSVNCLVKFDCNFFDLPSLESIDLSSNNLIKTIVRRPLKSVTNLYLQNNRLSTLSPLSCPNLVVLNISNNKLASCASLKPLTETRNLQILDCRNNSVTERRVYVDFIKSQVPSVIQLDDEKMNDEIEMTRRRLSKAIDLNSMSRRNSMVTSSMLSWFEKQESEMLEIPRSTSFLEEAPRKSGIRLEPIKGRKINDSEGFMLFGTKIQRHSKK